MAETWRLLDTGIADGPTNMAVDEAILQEHQAGGVPPTVRFYGWDPPTISLGYGQSLEKEIDVAALEKRRLGLVRRLTGGRAVLHDREVTYSIVVREDHPLVEGGILPSYLRIAGVLARGLRSLGAPVEVASGRKNTGEHSSAACFDAPSWYEITVAGRKMVGSAQTRKGGVLLQHGSIVLELNVDDLFAVLRFSSSARRERLKEKFALQACGLWEVLGRPVGPEEVKEAITRSFAEMYGINLVYGDLTPREKFLVEELRHKYAGREWNWRR
ncbi:MAG: Octanoyltransferase LipM [Moorella sp. 60_41]|nr:MAG: Octanoyltransferase LipM [Moorella sp. 60_41]